MYLEEDDTIIAEPELTGDDDDAVLVAHKARCTEKNMAYMNLYTMQVEKDVTFKTLFIIKNSCNYLFK